MFGMMKHTGSKLCTVPFLRLAHLKVKVADLELDPIKNWKLFFCVSLKYEMLGKLHLICMKTKGFHAKIRCNLNDISLLSETQKNNLQFL